jgi:hypothetical protein
VTLLTAFGIVTATAMLVTYALEEKSHWFTLALSGSCALASVYVLLQGAWPFAILEAIWAAVAFAKWLRRKSHSVDGR